MSNSLQSDRSKIRRIPSRGHYDAETIYQILDAHFLCHVATIRDGKPLVIPTAYGRKGEVLYLHSSIKSGLYQLLSQGAEAAICVTCLDGLVLARSSFNHSMNYRSVVLYGPTEVISDPEEKNEALRIVSEQILPGRWEEARKPTPNELKATGVLRFVIQEGAAKIRSGPPEDDRPDYELDIWAGVVPFVQQALPAEADPVLKAGLEIPESVRQLLRDQG